MTIKPSDYATTLQAYLVAVQEAKAAQYEADALYEADPDLRTLEGERQFLEAVENRKFHSAKRNAFRARLEEIRGRLADEIVEQQVESLFALRQKVESVPGPDR
jgi:hypothetical protein